ncbi:MAG: capsular biosynthesis protein [Oscillospiraceae bacterium]|nr:capsular biosynthesis protein [Candidatus Limimonas egerieequi]
MNENMQNDSYVEIDLFEILSILKSNLLWIILSAVLFAIAGWAYTTYAITPQYEASVNMIVNTKTDNTSAVSTDTINSARNLVSTYAIIIKSNTVLNQVIKDLDIDNMTYDTLEGKVSVNAINDTQVMRVAVQDPDPELARKIVKEIAKISPEEIVDAVEAGSCKVVSQVRVSSSPISPNVTKNMALAAIVGIAVVMVIVVVKSLLANYIVDDDDIQKYLGLPILGVIPEIEEG